jgi:hypothetical protein
MVTEQALDHNRFAYLTYRCYIRNKKQEMYNKHAFTMTYIPGMNITYEEDEAEPTGKNNIMYGLF